MASGTVIAARNYDEERALYHLTDAVVRDCSFAGPADGESVLKECRNITVENCRFSLRYPLWHAQNFLCTGLCYALSEALFLLLYQTFYRVLKHKYLYTELLLQYGALLVACILLAAAAAGISTVRKLRKSNLSEILAEEERS